MDRLVRRTRVKRSTYTVLGASLSPSLAALDAGADDSDGSAAAGEGADGAEGSKRSLKEEVDVEAYDDTGESSLRVPALVRGYLERRAPLPALPPQPLTCWPELT